MIIFYTNTAWSWNDWNPTTLINPHPSIIQANAHSSLISSFPPILSLSLFLCIDYIFFRDIEIKRRSLMDLSLSQSIIPTSIIPYNKSRTFNFTLFPNFPNSNSQSKHFLRKPLISRQNRPIRIRAQTPTVNNNNNNNNNNDGFVLEDVPHLTNFLPDLPVSNQTLFLNCFFFSLFSLFSLSV